MTSKCYVSIGHDEGKNTSVGSFLTRNVFAYEKSVFEHVFTVSTLTLCILTCVFWLHAELDVRDLVYT